MMHGGKKKENYGTMIAQQSFGLMKKKPRKRGRRFGNIEKSVKSMNGKSGLKDKFLQG